MILTRGRIARGCFIGKFNLMLDCFCGRPIRTLVDSIEGNVDVIPSKLPLCMGDLPSLCVFLESTWDNIPNDITVSSAIFAGLMVVTDRQTGTPRYSVCSNTPQLTIAVMRPKRCQFDGKYAVL